MRQGTEESNGFAAHDFGILLATSQNKEKGSHDLSGNGREDNRSNKSDNLEMDTARKNDNQNGQRKYTCCGKDFDTYQGLRIHQGKVCKKKKGSQQRRSVDHKTRSEFPQEENHSGDHSIVEEDKPGKEYHDKKSKIKWPKANDTAKYEKFDIEVAKIVSRYKGSTEKKLG